MSKIIKLSLLISIILFSFSFYLSPINSVMGVSLDWEQVYSFASQFGFFFFIIQFKLFFYYFIIIFFFLMGINFIFNGLHHINILRNTQYQNLYSLPEFKTKIQRYKNNKKIILILFIVWFFLFWASVGRNPQIYQDIFYSPKFMYYFLIIYDFISPHIIYYAFYIIYIIIFLIGFFTVLRHLYIRLPIPATFNHHFNKTLYLVIVLLSGFIFYFTIGFLKSRTPSAPQKLHIWLGIDSLRNEEVFQTNLMPNLKKIINQGVALRHHHVSLPRTYPAFATMYTGLEPIHHSIRHMFPDEADLQTFTTKENLVNYLKKKNYKTIAVADFAGDVLGRMGLKWDVFKAPNLSMKEVIRFQSLKTQVFLIPFLANYYGIKIEPSMKEWADFAVSEYLIQDSIQSLEDVLHDPIEKTSHAKKNIFLQIFMGTAHFPYSPPWPYYKNFRLKNYRGRYLYKKYINPLYPEKPNEIDKKQIKQIFRASLSSIDASIGQLWNYLKKKDYLKNTVLYVFGDHGENLYEKLSDGSTYQGHGEHLRGNNAIKTPWVIYAGKNIKKTNSWFNKINSHTLSSQLDMFQTSLDLLDEEEKSYQSKRSSVQSSMKLFETEKRKEFLSQTGIWFSAKGNYQFQKQRIMYPELSKLSGLSQSGSFYLRPEFKHIIEISKFRSLDIIDSNKSYRVIYRPLREIQDQIENYSFYEYNTSANVSKLKSKWKKLSCNEINCMSLINLFKNRLKKEGFIFYKGYLYPPL